MGSGGPAGTADHTDTERTACLLTSKVERRLRTEIIFDKKAWNIYEKEKLYTELRDKCITEQILLGRPVEPANLICFVGFSTESEFVSHFHIYCDSLTMSEIQPAEPPKDGFVIHLSKDSILF